MARRTRDNSDRKAMCKRRASDEAAARRRRRLQRLCILLFIASGALLPAFLASKHFGGPALLTGALFWTMAACIATACGSLGFLLAAGSPPSVLWDGSGPDPAQFGSEGHRISRM